MTPQERDDAILEHLRRYHLTTPEVLHRLFFPTVSMNAVTKVTSRLTREGRISKPLRLFEQRRYFVLTPREAVRLGEHRSIARKFEYQGLVNAYAVLSFTAENGTRKFTPKEFEEKFPELTIRGVRSGNYYIDVEETGDGSHPAEGTLPAVGRKSRLAFMLVDYGTSPETILKKVRKIIARGYTLPAFARLIQRGNFVIAIIAPSPAKVEAIKAVLSDEAPGPVRFRVEAVRELEELLLHLGKLGHRGRVKKKNDQAAELEPETSQAPQALSEEGASP